MMNNLITGLPRSGTTLVCHLLNKLPNTVALHEPLDTTMFKDAGKNEILATLNAAFAAQREQILTQGTAKSKSSDGRVPSNHLTDIWINGSRKRLLDGMLIKVDNIVDHNFKLFIKHPAVFTALLPLLSEHYPCYAIVRNPLSVLLSWRTASMAVSRGRAPAAEMADPDLSHRLNSVKEILDRQLILLDYFFHRYATSSRAKVLHYEDIIATSGKTLSILTDSARNLNEPLVSRNLHEVSDDANKRAIAFKLLESENACWAFYSREDVIRLMVAGKIHL